MYFLQLGSPICTANKPQNISIATKPKITYTSSTSQSAHFFKCFSGWASYKSSHPPKLPALLVKAIVVRELDNSKQ